MEQHFLADKSKRVKIPYSIWVAAIGLVLGIFGCISIFCEYRKSRDCTQQDHVLNLIPADQATDLTIMQETLQLYHKLTKMKTLLRVCFRSYRLLLKWLFAGD